MSAEGLTNVVAAGRCGVEPHTVAKWRRRFLEQRLDRLVDEPRPGRPATVPGEDGRTDRAFDRPG
ncbi:putative transposase [Pseudarthrobacter siccitolerans]|uniref:Putative transposase n=1 Tax=Pseudarthrobacter siccitolerans TaxID=861266 RepID=A0A024H8E3_9MICC|nr:putative transposase [Pseudarthrobacter siccitolerans]